MSGRQIAIGIGIGAATLGGASMLVSVQAHAYGTALNQSIVSGAQWLFSSGIITAVLGYLSQYVPALKGGSVPELLAALTAWLADKQDKKLQRRFMLAVLAEMSDLAKEQPEAQKLISQLGHSMVDLWLPAATPTVEAK